jgi:hypothetical protein
MDSWPADACFVIFMHAFHIYQSKLFKMDHALMITMVEWWNLLAAAAAGRPAPPAQACSAYAPCMIIHLQFSYITLYISGMHVPSSIAKWK